MATLVLASSSAVRADLLRRWGVDFRVEGVPDGVEEAVPAPRPADGASAARFAMARARAKARSVHAEGEVVVAADTVGLLGGDLLGKPGSDAEVEALLRRLSGRRHSVITGLWVGGCGTEAVGSEESVLELAPLTEAEIALYRASGEGIGKCGAIAIEGRLRDRFRRLSGSRSNVLGLPLALLRDLARRAGLDLPPPPRGIENMRAA